MENDKTIANKSSDNIINYSKLNTAVTSKKISIKHFSKGNIWHFEKKNLITYELKFLLENNTDFLLNFPSYFWTHDGQLIRIVKIITREPYYSGVIVNDIVICILENDCVEPPTNLIKTTFE